MSTWRYQHPGHQWLPVVQHTRYPDQPVPANATYHHIEYKENDDGTLKDMGWNAWLTPNNVIHELAHQFNAFAGFGTHINRGSVETALPESYTREGLGHPRPSELYLQVGSIQADGSINANVPPSDILGYDIFGDEYQLWNDLSPFKHAPTQLRVDVFRHSPETSANEIQADGFVSWVRNAFDTDSSTAEGTNWQQFWDNNMGSFLRNSILSHQSPEERLAYYRSLDGVSSVLVGQLTLDPHSSFLARTTPQVAGNNIAGTALSIFGTNPVNIYGHVSATQTESSYYIDPDGEDNSVFWYVTESPSGQPLWIASNAFEGELYSPDDFANRQFYPVNPLDYPPLNIWHPGDPFPWENSDSSLLA